MHGLNFSSHIGCTATKKDACAKMKIKERQQKERNKENHK